MIEPPKIYCLDANVLIQAWQKYYSINLCPNYWDLLNELGERRKIFIPEIVKDEIVSKEDDLTKWLKASKIPIEKIDDIVISKWHEIQDANHLHKFLVDNTKNRSLADPWLIAHSMKLKATVVTKESKVTDPSSKKIRIPNVCENMNVTYIDDFEFLEDIGIRFKAFFENNLL